MSATKISFLIWIFVRLILAAIITCVIVVVGLYLFDFCVDFAQDLIKNK